MANLNEDEKNTLAVTRYWFENQKKVRALVTKLVKSFDDEDVARLTGIPVAEVWAYVKVPARKPFAQTEGVPTDFMTKHGSGETRIVDHIAETETESLAADIAKYLRVASQINDLIAEMGLKSGDRLPVGEELSEKFGVSRKTINNAIKYLKQNDVVKAMRGQGIFVA